MILYKNEINMSKQISRFTLLDIPDWMSGLIIPVVEQLEIKETGV